MHKVAVRILVTLSFVLVALSAFAVGANYEVFVGTYSGPHSKGIYTFHFDSETGKSAQPQLAAETENPSFLALDPENHFLYAVNEIENYKEAASGAVSVFAIDPKSKKLTFRQQVASLGGAPAHLTVDPAGNNLLVANYGGGNVVVFPIGKDGLLGEHSALDQHAGSSINPERQKGPHAHEIELTSDNRFAMSPDLGLDKIIVSRFDAARGTLTPNDPPFAKVAPGSGPRHIVFARSDKFAYVVNEMAASVTVFSLDPRTGAMHKVQTISTVARRSRSDTAAEISLDPTGRFLYTSTRKADVITQYSIDQRSGKLKLVGRVSSGGKTPRFFTLDPSGRWMFVANQNSDVVVLFSVDRETGKLSPTGSRLEIGSPACLVFVPASGD